MSGFELTTIDGRNGGRAHLVHADHVNWVLLQDDSGVTLIDGGYPRQAEEVGASLTQIGAGFDDVRGALVTHAHVDHIGGLRILAEEYGFPVYMDPAEVPHARREYLQQATPLDIAMIAYRPRVLRWLIEVSTLGVMSKEGIPTSQAFPVAGALDLPGRPMPVALPGHTAGHSAYLVAGGEVLVSGDALITGHGVSSTTGPQCLHHAFHHDLERNRESLPTLVDLDAEVIFPGHGDAWYGTVADAVNQALTR